MLFIVLCMNKIVYGFNFCFYSFYTFLLYRYMYIIIKLFTRHFIINGVYFCLFVFLLLVLEVYTDYYFYKKLC